MLAISIGSTMNPIVIHSHQSSIELKVGIFEEFKGDTDKVQGEPDFLVN